MAYFDLNFCALGGVLPCGLYGGLLCESSISFMNHLKNIITHMWISLPCCGWAWAHNGIKIIASLFHSRACGLNQSPFDKFGLLGVKSVFKFVHDSTWKWESDVHFMKWTAIDSRMNSDKFPIWKSSLIYLRSPYNASVIRVCLQKWPLASILHPLLLLLRQDASDVKICSWKSKGLKYDYNKWGEYCFPF